MGTRAPHPPLRMATKMDPPPAKAPVIRAMQLGVWRILTAPKQVGLAARVQRARTAAAFVWRTASDIWRLDPALFGCLLVAQAWQSVEPIILLAVSSRLLATIESGLRAGRADARAIVNAVVARLACVAVAAVVRWWCEYVRPQVKARITGHFTELVLSAHLNTDLPTSTDNANKVHVNPDEIFYAYEFLLSYIAEGVSTIGFLVFIFYTTHKGSGSLFTLLCLVKPLIWIVTTKSLLSKAHIAYSTNENHIRMEALQSMGKKEFRKDVISGNLIGYILAEYEKAKNALGGVSTDHPHNIYARDVTPIWKIAGDLAGDLPLVYYAANAIFQPSKFSLTSVAVLEQSSTLLRGTLLSMFTSATWARQKVSTIQHLYDYVGIDNHVADGELAYPSAQASPEGMAFELRNVTFAYPGSKAGVNALDNVSFSIKPGQLVVVVGANGSGKSTMVNLLTRLYDTNSGEITVDGQDIRRYRLSELRQATAVLTQDHQLFPLTVAENIGLGNPARVADVGSVMEAAQMGGADKLITRLKQGLFTTPHPVRTVYGSSLRGASGDTLRAELEQIEKRTDVSGGEQQRITASRVFMRFGTGRVRFVAVDEPSSALDPEGEWALFANLRRARAGKTLVFVTHRFGHLTKFADVIICMKEGRVAESGTHSELLASDGEYAKLYHIQANAFVEESQ